MKNKLLMLLTIALSVSMIGCGSTADTPATDEASQENTQAETSAETEASVTDTTTESEDSMEDYPDNFLEERLNQFSFASYDEIIGDLETGEAYAYITMMGYDDPILVITDATFNGYDEPACMECYPYLPCADGTYQCGSIFSTISTGTPIAITDDGLVYCATHTDMSVYALTGDPYPGVMCMEYVYTEYDENGEPGTYGGFIRSTNSIENDGEKIAEDDAAAFEQAFTDYDEKTTPIGFTVVE